MASATDIITYIGIPLAVLGVLPILYTFILSIITSRRIRHLLIQHGHKPRNVGKNAQEGFMLRASPMTSLIEIEVPRYTIAPVDRNDERYWEVSDDGRREEHTLLGGHIHAHEHVSPRRHDAHGVERQESTLSMLEEGRVRGFLRGGSWRTFHWRRLVVGRKLYRIQYEDELREPPAEIEFADLVNFLMDWGAELDEMGWERLRNGGLWTPAGTVLLRAPDDDVKLEIDDTKAGSIGSASLSGVVNRSSSDWVLRTSMPDDSDGILTLCVQWPQGRGYRSERTATSLPPGWGRLRFPLLTDNDEISDDNDEKGRSVKTRQTLSSMLLGLSKPISDLSQDSSNYSLRFKLDSNLITSVQVELCNRPTGSTLSLSTLSKVPNGLEWFTTCASALLSLHKTRSAGAVYGFTPPADLISLARKDTVPAGVLVLLSLLKPEDAPAWDLHSSARTADLDRAFADQTHKRFHARMTAERLEATMPPEQARAHRLNREADDRRAQHENFVQYNAAKKDREHRRRQDALVSSRVGVAVVAAACREWLIEHDDQHMSSDWEVEDIAHAVLWLLVLQSQTDNTIIPTDKFPDPEHQSTENNKDKDESTSPHVPTVLHILDEWSAWTSAGGMKTEQFELLAAHRREFCYAACLVAVVHRAATLAGEGRSPGKASVDMLECLRLWRKVRLG